MIKLPKVLKKFSSEAEAFLASEAKNNITVDFVDSFYEVSIPDQNSSFIWRCCFKISSSSELVDSFCSCPEEELGCAHIAIAYLYIHQNYNLPLHTVFINSFWYTLFHSLYLVFKKTLPSYEVGTWEFHLDSLKVTIKPTSHKLSHKISDLLSINTKSFEASMKYSNFTSNELTNWKENAFFQKDDKFFLLSLWYELGKFCFFLSLNNPYKMYFSKKNAENFPDSLIIDWEDVSFSFQLTKDIIHKCIPFLDTIDTNLSLWPQTKSILSINSLPNKHSLEIQEELLPIPQALLEESHYTYKNITYIPEKGFIITNKKASYTLHANQIPLWLINKQHLLDAFVHPETYPIAYEFSFDIHANLHCFPFLFENKDIKTQGIIINSHLVFINDKGFYKISRLFNSEPEFIIPNKKIEYYLDNHPNLFTCLGFQIFSNPPETHTLTFSVNDNDSLLFFYSNQSSSNNQTFQFGKWIYHENMGFFLNKELSSNEAIKNGTIINKDAISSFIEKNQEQLKQIPNFFHNAINFKDIIIEIKQTHKTKITLVPFLKKGEITVPCKIFQHYVFTEKDGFSPLIFTEEEASFCSLYPKELQGSAITSFYNQELKKLNNVFTFSSKKITPSENQTLFLISLVYDSHNQLLAELKFITNIGSLSFNEIVTATKSNKEFLFSEAGYINISDSAFKLISYLKEKESVTRQGFYLSIIDILKIDALFPISIEEHASEETKSNFAKIKDYCIPHPPELSSQHKHLRPYQKNGLLWLWFLYHNGISGLLCDEMGLGKTHQAMALINTCALTVPSAKLFLVVCPTSVLMHWVILLKDYFSNLPSFFFHTKTKKSALPNHGVIVTSYGMLRHQYKLFYEKQIEIAIFDEIQLAKNKSSQIHKILCRLDAKMKLGLTGTPIENNVQELKALFDVVLPNYLPPDPIFKNLFSQTANKNQITEKNRVLKIIKPFILRRTKNNVLPELPNKIEKNLICHLSEEQKQLYTQLIKQESSLVSELMSSDQATPSYVHIFALLNHLKQICDHPAVYLKNPDNYKKHVSGKWNIFTNLLDTNLANGNKIVIFSQYLSMIEIMSTYLKQNSIEFAVIHGKSQNRQKEVDRFQNDPNCKVFLGSLLASGVGINLTAGNVVIMYDRWWNPAKENQALDRVHRIGQKNTVFIYRLITANSIEEKIHKLIEKKSHLFSEVIPNNETESLKMLNKEDLLEILNYKATYDDDVDL